VAFEESVEHNLKKRVVKMHDFEEPTEPMSRVFLPPYSMPTFQTDISTDQNAIPAPQLDEVPFPKSGMNPVDISGMSAIPPIYPILLPATPVSNYGGSSGVTSPDVNAVKPEAHLKRKTRRSWFPSLVGLLGLVVEFLLLLRLVISLFGTPISHVWVGFVYTVSTFFLLPFFLLLENVKIPLINGTEFYSDLIIVCAIFVYGFISRILVRFLKVLLNES
jgi:hypothetical protein